MKAAAFVTSLGGRGVAVAAWSSVAAAWLAAGCGKQQASGDGAGEAARSGAIAGDRRAASTGDGEKLLASTVSSSGLFDWALIADGRTVVAIDAATAAELANGVALENGRTLACRIQMLRTEFETGAGVDPTSVGARAGWWLNLSSGGRSRRWWTEAPQTGGTTSAGAWVAIIDATGVGMTGITPANIAERGGRPGGRQGRVRWLEAPAADAAAEGVFARALDEAAWESAWVRASLTAAESSPLTRWRARLARGELVQVAAKTTDDSRSFDDEVVEELARTIERQWSVALVRLARRDPALAREVVKRLSLTVDFGGGVVAPAWPPEGPALSVLLEGLLSGSDQLATDAAQVWLAEVPASLCWIADDAGVSDAGTGLPMGSVGIANLTNAPFAAWVEKTTPTGAPEILAVSPRSIRRLPVAPITSDAGGPVSIAADAANKGERLTVRVGDETSRPTVYSVRAPALAPGVVIGPLHPDWRLADWYGAGRDEDWLKREGPWSRAAGGGAAGRIEPEWTTNGMVYRGVDAPLESGGAAQPDRWLLYLEMTRAPDATARPGVEPFVRVWFGPLGRVTGVLKVLEDGRVIDDSGAREGARDLPRLARVVSTPSGWTCWLPIPASAIERDGTVRIGVERIDERGVRTSWPRPSMPWQQEPSRLAIDTKVWSGR